MAAAAVDKLVFAVNGRRYEVAGADPSTRLLEFIRTQTPFKGTKLGCGEAAIYPNAADIVVFQPSEVETLEGSTGPSLSVG